ncbi:hypothetical protein L1987_80779 [Smallanthus sonchifolius]|uniref:Uncharacterized protein n=1 Tax=Smallanthus sonchifolius TaxID=185202 RepID=A0ACB8YNT6_9ASTR|nr:hypothetical protein L1987_80779 [Smallanthus sonchifolius]
MSVFASTTPSCGTQRDRKKPNSALIRQLGTIKEGLQETTFIEQLIETTFESQMEATNLGYSKIMNWHLHLEAHELGYPKGWLLQKNLDVVLPIKVPFLALHFHW